MVKSTRNEQISVREAAKECGRNPETVRRWIWSGKLPAQKLGNQLFVKREDLARYCRETTVAPYHVGSRVDNFKEDEITNMIHQMREERMEQIEEALRDTSVALGEAKSETKADFLERAIALQNRIRARGGQVVDAEAMIRELRRERERGRIGNFQNPEIRPGSRADLIKRMRKLRSQIRARVGNLDVNETIEQLREERVNELTSLH